MKQYLFAGALALAFATTATLAVAAPADFGPHHTVKHHAKATHHHAKAKHHAAHKHHSAKAKHRAHAQVKHTSAH